jgi:hypothetical protein
MGKKCKSSHTNSNYPKVRFDLSKKPPLEIVHLISVLKKLEKQGKIKIKELQN